MNLSIFSSQPLPDGIEAISNFPSIGPNGHVAMINQYSNQISLWYQKLPMSSSHKKTNKSVVSYLEDEFWPEIEEADFELSNFPTHYIEIANSGGSFIIAQKSGLLSYWIKDVSWQVYHLELPFEHDEEFLNGLNFLSGFV